MPDAILTLSMRPTKLSEMVGQNVLVEAIRKQMVERPPQAIMFTGGTGTGKTTLARIVAVALQCDHQKVWGAPCEECWAQYDRKGFSIHEINASSERGVEDLEKIAEVARYQPNFGKQRVIILDECFTGDTLLDTPNYGTIPFNTIRAGDSILNAAGSDVVKHVWRRKVKRAIKIGYFGKSVICSRNHLFFTTKGWVRACDLKVGECLVRTSQAMRMVSKENEVACGVQYPTLLLPNLRETFASARYTGTAQTNSWRKDLSAVRDCFEDGKHERLQTAILQSHLRSSLCFSVAGNQETKTNTVQEQQPFTQPRVTSEGRRNLEEKPTCKEVGVFKGTAAEALPVLFNRFFNRFARVRTQTLLRQFLCGQILYAGSSTQREHSEAYANEQSDVQTRGGKKDVRFAAGDRAPSQDNWWKRSGAPQTATTFVKRSWFWLGTRIRCFFGDTPKRLSDLLQNRYCQFKKETGDRGRWPESQIPALQGTGCKESKSTYYVRVESVAVLERGNPELEYYREEDGFIYFYDLEAERHPSFSVNGVLVHNCQKASNAAQNLLLKPTEDPPPTTTWIIATTEPTKILATLRRRFVTYQLKGLDSGSTELLLKRAAKRINSIKITCELQPLLQKIEEQQVTSAALVLMAFEQYAAGLPAGEAIAAALSAGVSVDTFAICKAVTSGRSKELRSLLQKVSPEETYWVRASVLGWLRSCFFREVQPTRLTAIADSMKELADGRAPMEPALLLNWLIPTLYKITRRFAVPQ